MTLRRITHKAFLEQLRLQEVPRQHLAFICPLCRTVQSMDDFIRAGSSEKEAGNLIGFSCIGRKTGAGSPRKEPDGKPCNWSLGGLFQLHELEVKTSDGHVQPCFEIATPEQAKAHMQTKGETP